MKAFIVITRFCYSSSSLASTVLKEHTLASDKHSFNGEKTDEENISFRRSCGLYYI